MFAASDTQALRRDASRTRGGICVPGGFLSVIGFDDIEMAEDPNLTTIHQPLFDSDTVHFICCWS